MTLMIDKDLRNEIGAAPPRLVSGIDAKNLEDFVHGCAVEFRIGEIFVPGSAKDEAGSADHPRERHALGEGATAVIRTLESFQLDSQHTAVVFPVSSVSLQGLLMTNPGHVDPGYKGSLHVTVINMGRQPFLLRKGDRLLRALIFDLSREVASPYEKRSTAPGTPARAGSVGLSRLRDKLLMRTISTLEGMRTPKQGSASPGPVTGELLSTLSPDFLSVSSRGAAAAKREIDGAMRASAIWQFALPAIVAGLTAFGTAWLTNNSLTNQFSERLATVEAVKASDRISKLEGDFANEKRMTELETRLQKVEGSGASRAP
jgi:dCTP deaminase